MKMEVTVTASAAGVIEALDCAAGDAVVTGQRLMVIRVESEVSGDTEQATAVSGEEAACE